MEFALLRNYESQFNTLPASLGSSAVATSEVPAQRASFRLNVILGHLAAGDREPTAMLPWPLRDALGQDLRSDHAGLFRVPWKVVIDRRTALDAERWWPAL
mmetsp:Transcript_15062/g.25576  ORF Transcript_15062/g.25576 Transcript_15062/m.25576 type:complete len:101 (-) Transcript_15062:90-392(-)